MKKREGVYSKFWSRMTEKRRGILPFSIMIERRKIVSCRSGCCSQLGWEMGRQRRNTVPSVAEEEKSTVPPKKFSPKSFMA